MSRVRQRGTTPELAVARTLRGVGAYHRLNVRSLPGSPDLANKAVRPGTVLRLALLGLYPLIVPSLNLALLIGFLPIEELDCRRPA